VTKNLILREQKKLLLDYLERAEEENNELKSFRNLYHKVDKELGICKKNSGPTRP